MALPDREAIMSALRDRLEREVDGMRTVTRRAAAFGLAPFPAMLVAVDGFGQDELGRWVILASVNVKVSVADASKTPETSLNDFIDAVVDALSWQQGESPTFGMGATTLGDVVQSCDVTGTIEVRQGIDGLGEAVIPVEIIAYEQD